MSEELVLNDAALARTAGVYQGAVAADANEAYFFARQLEHIKARTFDIKYAAFNALRVLPVSSEAGPGAETITYEQYDQVGLAKLIASYADDLPRADIKGREFMTKVRSIGSSYGYNVQEIRNAQMAGKSLESERAAAARRSVDQKMNSLAWLGDDAHGLQGFFSASTNIPNNLATADGNGSATTFASKIDDPDKIIRDVNELINDIETDTKGVHRANYVMMPIDQYALLNSTPRSSTTDTTVLQFLRNNNPGVTFEAIHEMSGKGAGSTDVMVAMERSNEVIEVEVPQPFEQFPVQERGLEFVVPCHARFGGVSIRYPLAINIVRGI